jgi:predicted ATPase
MFLTSASVVKVDKGLFNKYPYNVPSIKLLDKINFHNNVTFLVGENGTGKSTLLEAIAVSLGFNPEGGSKNFHFQTSENQQYADKVIRIKCTNTRPQDNYFLRAESFYNVASNIDYLDAEAEKYGGYGTPIKNFFGGKSLHEQSHGESFFSLINNRLTGNGLYLFDEPEAALSPMKQMAMISRIHDLCSEGSQFVIATHSPIILSYPNSIIYQIDEQGLDQVLYHETETYLQTKNFLNQPEKMLNILLN